MVEREVVFGDWGLDCGEEFRGVWIKGFVEEMGDESGRET